MQSWNGIWVPECVAMISHPCSLPHSPKRKQAAGGEDAHQTFLGMCFPVFHLTQALRTSRLCFSVFTLSACLLMYCFVLDMWIATWSLLSLNLYLAGGRDNQTVKQINVQTDMGMHLLKGMNETICETEQWSLNWQEKASLGNHLDWD